jgi:hypothetical protein
MKLSKSTERRLGLGSVLAVVALVALIIGNRPASADTVGPGNYCVQDNLRVNKLNCTAEDVKLAGVKRVNGVPLISPTECTSGEYFDLTVTLLVSTTATSRYDIGVTFDTNGDPEHDGARTGTCSRSDLPTSPSSSGYLNLDGDACGDTASANSPVDLQVTIAGVKCADTDGDLFLNLPYIVSWANVPGNVCSNAAEALPGTTAKCKADDTFNVPVHVAEPNNALTKTATVVVTYPIVLTNNASTLTLTLNSLTDDAYGNIANASNTSILSTTCGLGGSGNPGTLPATIAANGNYSCSFKVQFDQNHPGSSTAVANVVTAEGTASDGVHPAANFTTQSNNGTALSVTVFIQ